MFLAFWATCRPDLTVLGTASNWQILRLRAPSGQVLQGRLQGGAITRRQNAIMGIPPLSVAAMSLAPSPSCLRAICTLSQAELQPTIRGMSTLQIWAWRLARRTRGMLCTSRTSIVCEAYHEVQKPHKSSPSSAHRDTCEQLGTVCNDCIVFLLNTTEVVHH